MSGAGIAAIIGLLVVVAAALMVLWIADARRADRVAHDPERTEESDGQPPA